MVHVNKTGRDFTTLANFSCSLFATFFSTACSGNIDINVVCPTGLNLNNQFDCINMGTWEKNLQAPFTRVIFF